MSIIIILWDYTGDTPPETCSNHYADYNEKFKDVIQRIMKDINKDDNFINKLSSLKFNFTFGNSNTQIENNMIFNTLSEIGIRVPLNYNRIRLNLKYS